MRSLIILEVEHGEDTDALYELANFATVNSFVDGARVIDYTVRVDLPECFVLDSGNDGQGTCQSHTDIHAFNDDCVGFRDSL